MTEHLNNTHVEEENVSDMEKKGVGEGSGGGRGGSGGGRGGVPPPYDELFCLFRPLESIAMECGVYEAAYYL